MSDDFFNDRELTRAQAEALDAASSRAPVSVKTRELPSRKKQATDEIDQLREENERLRGLLSECQPFVRLPVSNGHLFKEIQKEVSDE